MLKDTLYGNSAHPAGPPEHGTMLCRLLKSDLASFATLLLVRRCFVDCHSLLVCCCSWFAVCCPLFALLFRSLLLTVCHLLFMVCCSVFVIGRSLLSPLRTRPPALRMRPPAIPLRSSGLVWAFDPKDDVVDLDVGGQVGEHKCANTHNQALRVLDFASNSSRNKVLSK